MISNKSIICFIITLCFSISGLFAESSKSVILKDLKKIKQHAQLKERVNQTKEFKKRIDHQKKFAIRNKIKMKEKLTIGSDKIQSSRQFLSRSGGSADPISILINGYNSVEVEQFQNVELTITFSEGENSAEVQFGLDMNGDGLWTDGTDFIMDIDYSELAIDNDEMDENPADGIWVMTWEDDEGPQMFADLGVFVMVTDAGGSDMAYLNVVPKETDFSISGQMTDENGAPVEIPNIIVQSFSLDDSLYNYDYEMDMTFGICVTKPDGSYTLYLPTEGDYFLMAFDEFDVSNMFMKDSFYDSLVGVTGHEAGYDFTILAGNAWIDGYVIDDDGNPVFDAQVEAWSYSDYDYNYDYYGYQEFAILGDYYSVYGSTNSSGYFNLPVLDGGWEVTTYNHHLIPDYMDTPNDYQVVTAIENDTVSVVNDFMIYKTDAAISGNIYLDGALYTDYSNVSGYNGNWAWDVDQQLFISNGTGYTYTETSDGTYSLAVASEGDGFGYLQYHWDEYGYLVDSSFVTGYDINIDFWELPDYVIPSFDSLQFHSGVQSGSTNINFYLTSVSGGVEGVVTNDAGEALEGAWIYASGVIEGSPGDSLWYWNETNTDENGEFELYLLPGEYNFSVEYWDYGYYYYEDDENPIYCSYYWTDTIGESMVEKNITLSTIEMAGSVSGQITDEEGNPIWGHYVYVEGDGGCGDYGWYASYWTDQDGSYRIDLPNGNYTISTWDNCSDTGDVNEDLVINNNDLTMDFTVCPYYNDDCHQYSQDYCGNYDHCWWDYEYNECVHDYDEGDEGPPECLLGCGGIENIDGDDPMQVCALLDSIWGIAGSCADDCEDDEDYQELNMIAYMCTGCFDAESTSNTTCVDWFYFLDDMILVVSAMMLVTMQVAMMRIPAMKPVMQVSAHVMLMIFVVSATMIVTMKVATMKMIAMMIVMILLIVPLMMDHLNAYQGV